MPTFSASPTSMLEVRLSEHGIVSDATNGLDYGATSPSGATGQEAAINAILAAAASASPAGVHVVWDVAVAIGGPIYVYSNMSVEAPNPSCGAILRASVNCPMWRVHGTETAPSNNTSTASQNCFGKQDPAHSSDYRYRVFDPSFVNVKNIAFLGGTWNGNHGAQTSGLLLTTQYGFLNNFQVWGADGVTFRGIRSFLSNCYNIHIVNARHVVIEDCDFEQTISMGGGSDSIHFNGPCTDLQISRVRTHNPDDNLAFNADDGATQTTSGGTVTAGINWSCSGPISTVRVRDHLMWNGRENVQMIGGIRLLSTVARIDDVIIRGWSMPPGQNTSQQAINIGIFTPCLIDGSGNVGRVVLDDFTADMQNTGVNFDGYVGDGVIAVKATVESLEIRNRYRANAQNAPDVYVASGGNVKSLAINGTWYQPSSASNNQPIVQVDGGTVGTLYIQGRSYRDAATGAAAALQVKSSGTVTSALIDMDMSSVTNMVDIQSGSVGTLILKGAHRQAGGGSPVALASGATISNLTYGNGATPLAYAHASVAIKSGSGTVTNLNDYAEAASSPLLDLITSPVAGAYSLRKLRAAYAGSAIKVRRSSDNTTQDIGFDGSGNLDTAALATFVSSNSGYIDTWYDQSSNAKHATQSTTAAQFRIVNAGTLDISSNSRPGIKCLGTSGLRMTATSFGLSGGTFGSSSVFSMTNPAQGGRILSYAAPGQSHDYDNTGSMVFASWDASGQFLIFQCNTTSGNVISLSASSTVHQYTEAWDGTGHGVGILDGTTGSTVALSPSLTTAGTLVFGADLTTNGAEITGVMAEHIVINGTYSTGDRATVNASQKAYYGTP